MEKRTPKLSLKKIELLNLSREEQLQLKGGNRYAFGSSNYCTAECGPTFDCTRDFNCTIGLTMPPGC